MNSKKPKISIIIPVYNEEEHIGRCLDSIAKQTIIKETEVLIIDDDSTDNTIKIAKSFSKKVNLRVIRNGNKDFLIGKKIGLDNSKGDFFMYFDADMVFRDNNWAEATLNPLIKDKRITGSVASFAVNKKHNALTRCISYDIFQRDPIFAFFTPNIKSTFIKKEEGYYLCEFSMGKIPSQSLCLYRKEIIVSSLKGEKVFMDNDVMARLVKQGNTLFAFSPQVRVYHYLLKDLKELFKKRTRGVLKTYVPHFEKKEYKWFNLKKKSNIIKLGLWVIYANILVPGFIVGIYNSIRCKDLACLYYPFINIVSTDAMIYAFFKSKTRFSDLSKI